MLGGLLGLVGLFGAMSPLLAPASGACAHDRAAVLALDRQSFVQDPNNGWRPLADAGCEQIAADLIRDWRAAHDADAPLLYWHEGQLRANLGDTEAAIALFEQARERPEHDGFGWNLYVDATIAFLRRDKAALESSRARLVSLPKPANFPLRDLAGRIEINWPPNLEQFDALLRCWGRPYRIAYACPADDEERHQR